VLEEQNQKIAALHTVAAEIGRCETAEAVHEAAVAAAEDILEFDLAITDEVVDGVLRPRAVSSDLSPDEYYEETPTDAEDNFAAIAYGVASRRSSTISTSTASPRPTLCTDRLLPSRSASTVSSRPSPRRPAPSTSAILSWPSC